MYILTHYVYENICNVRKILTKSLSFFSSYLLFVSAAFSCFPFQWKLSEIRELFKVSISCLCFTELSNAETQSSKISFFAKTLWTKL